MNKYDKEFESLFNEGFVVIKDVIPKAECDDIVDRAVSVIESLGSGVNRDELESTWIEPNLPPQTRPGMFQAVLGRSEPFEKLRYDPRIEQIFRHFYSKLNKLTEGEEDLVTSLDGVNVKPGAIGPYATAKDWAHLDQATNPDVWACLQGQVVLTNTSAAFICSPRSHLLYAEVSKKFRIAQNGREFFKTNSHHEKWYKSQLRKIGGKWQTPVEAPAGSVIIWPSSMIHSAKLQNSPEFPTESDKFHGWRCVAYICKRPKSEFTQAELELLEDWKRNCRTTNHWALQVQEALPRFFHKNMAFHPAVQRFIDNPRLIQEI